MLLLLGAALALNFQGQTGPRPRRAPVVRDSVADTTQVDSAAARRRRGRRLAVTAEIAASAYKDAAAKTLMMRARAVRLRQDSALFAYDAISRERLSVGMGLGHIGRDRLLFRNESVGRVQWQRDVGVWIEVKGKRTGVPMAGKGVQVTVDDANDPDLNAPIPYFPGAEPLWIGGGVARAQVDETELVNPIADGSEAYYTYESGDSITWTIPGQKAPRRMQIREIKVRPREPKWNLAVGSLWFDTESGQVVRAAYRLSIPMDILAIAKADDSTSMDDVPVWVRPMISPMRAQISAIAVEYGLFEGKFWLPSVRLAEGDANVSFMHIPLKIQQSFTYASVNVPANLPAIHVRNGGPPTDFRDMTPEQRRQYRDSVTAAVKARTRARQDSLKRGLKLGNARDKQCDTSDFYVTTRTRRDANLAIAMRTPCDTLKLMHSPDLPGSIYDENEELFNESDMESLKKEALSLSAQAPFNFHHLPPPTIEYGPSLMRYNRVEGFSVGASGEQQLGSGYSAAALARFGFADREPNVELGVARTNFSETIALSGYNRLVSASDWGHPLNFSSSFSALVFGRDEGFYYRATGVQLSGTSDASGSVGTGTTIEWRAFLEQQRTAKVNTNFAIDGADFPPNLVAWRSTYTGLSGRINDEYGLDPMGLRLSTNFRFEAGVHDSVYGRAAVDFTASHPISSGLATSITLAGGSSLGAVPPQRLWYLGGSETVRGQSPDTAQSGNAFWLTRLELGSSDAGFRPTVFGDLGWVGDRNHIRDVGRPLSGVGVGASVLDGLFRFDVARGIYPRKQFRVDFYLESRF